MHVAAKEILVRNIVKILSQNKKIPLRSSRARLSCCSFHRPLPWSPPPDDEGGVINACTHAKGLFGSGRNGEEEGGNFVSGVGRGTKGKGKKDQMRLGSSGSFIIHDFGFDWRNLVFSLLLLVCVMATRSFPLLFSRTIHATTIVLGAHSLFQEAQSSPPSTGNDHSWWKLVRSIVRAGWLEPLLRRSRTL